MLNDVVVLYLVFKGASILFIKKSRIMPFAATWMDLQIIVLSEVRERRARHLHPGSNKGDACARACPVVSDALQPHGLLPARLLCPCSSPGRNPGVVCRFFLQGIFLTKG